ncbi:hypothetical protein DYB28_001763 [Aphanomyces astaci]|uniref:Uncharacterized protein n=2 Tax=Aphanomyces astaci TaxID=112090 RepID=A0A397E8Q8_APHAT|nr:hypothetical protein DYB25_009213 [Aphanomyces astaci]RHY78452.1 hypothetical protein DYB38_004746 [Aphanomyces astaci]RLO12160.1 hypothetical protein DYB28_001763 [Aphanomyces astaci]
MASIDELSQSIRQHVFNSTKEYAPIIIKEGMSEEASNLGTETRRKQGAEFWADFRDAARKVSGDDDITAQTIIVDDLEQRYNAVLAETKQLKRQAKTRSSDLYVDSRIHKLQEENERAWEVQMEAGKKSLERLEDQLAVVQHENDTLDATLLLQAHPPGNDGSHIPPLAPEQLREVLLLRDEEKGDLVAAIASLKRKHADRVNAQTFGDAASDDTLHELKATRTRLRESILSLTPSAAATDNNGEARIEEDAAALSTRLQRAHDALASHEANAALLKTHMRTLVQIKASERHVAAVLLHVLFEHDGEWTKNDLQTQVAAIVGVDESIVIRALYSLVASGLVRLDRSHALGLVTSLLV